MSESRKEKGKEKILFKRMISSGDITPNSKKIRVGGDKLLSSADLESKSQSKKIEKRKK